MTEQARMLGTAAGCMLALTLAASGAPDTEVDLATRLAWQIALERVGFSPGLIDGKPGPKTELATSEFQRRHGLPAIGKLDELTAVSLAVEPDKVLVNYVLQPSDLEQVGPSPKSWQERARLPRLDYESPAAMLAEKFHTSKAFLAQVNGGKDLAHMAPGQAFTVPAIPPPAKIQGHRLAVHLTQKVIRVLDDQGQLVALFHCSVAADKVNLPAGRATVTCITENPTYLFDPKKWPEVKDVDRKLLIPPGPRNPVGLCWIGLSLPGYGIHGNPHPELIGKTGSHGCIRLTNWDALRLGKMIPVGAAVAFSVD